MKKDINILFSDALDIMEDLNIEVETVTSVSWNNRLRSVWGRCAYDRRTNTYKIELNPILKDDNVSWDSVMDTMIHEVLHAHKDRFCHTGEWKKCAQLINYEYPCYHITRTTTAKEKNVVADRIGNSYKYIIKCNGCGGIHKYKKISKIVKLVRDYPGSCRCSCGCKNLTLTEI